MFSPLSPKGLQSVPCLPHRRDNTELLQHPKRIKVEPLFDTLLVCDTEDEDVCHGGLFACRCNVHENALVGTLPRVASDDCVSFSDQILNGEMQVGESCVVHRDEPYVGFETLDGR